MRITQLDTLDEVAALSGLIAEYLDFVTGELARHFGAEVDPGPLHAKTMREADLLIPPKGRCFVALDDDGTPFGMVLLRPCGADAMEIKRLYVRPGYRQGGVGRKLAQTALDTASGLGMRRVYLDSTRNLTGAIGLYQRMGFEFTGPYEGSDHAAKDDVLAPYVIFMKLDLTDEAAA